MSRDPSQMRREAGPVLALIPAKAGSTRLPRKNVLPLGGRPMLAWSVAAALESGVVDDVIVSTEDESVAAVAVQAGAEVPFLRPENLAVDPAGVVDVALHAIETLEGMGRTWRTLVILLPTAPFRNADDVRGAMGLFLEKGRPFLMSVSEFTHTPFAALKLGAGNELDPWFPEHSGKKSQEMPRAWRPNGAVHVLDVAAFRRERSYYARPLVGYPMPPERSLDVDTAMDFRIAEAMLKAGGA